ncbi:c-type cytochrome [Novipirellula caenicola]|uniref:c-type cytochrome n=1 Tax=Novipirellula caenicola TaxID=1536901 RepID=UPI0031ED102B
MKRFILPIVTLPMVQRSTTNHRPRAKAIDDRLPKLVPTFAGQTNHQGCVARNLCVISLVMLALAANASPAEGQTLTERLVTEAPVKLVQQARQDGDIVRGAILFHQGNINCAKCHRPVSESDRLAPDLSRLGQEVSDESIVESILLPSKTIRKGFETVSVLTVDGHVVNGSIVSQDDQKVVLRSSQNIEQLITFEQDDIEAIKPSAKSNMPDGLANELKDRQQFLDLLRYTLDLKQRGPTDDAANEDSLVRRELSDETKGIVLIKQLNCSGCHDWKTGESIPPLQHGPNLKWSAKWLNPDYLAAFIADPQHTKPGTSMPNMLSHLDDKQRTESATALVHFLTSLANNSLTAPHAPQSPVDLQADGEGILRGEELFHSIGCVACHSPRNDLAIEQPLEDSIPLGDLGNKYDTNALTIFLKNPHAVRPSGRMPNMQLTHLEAQDLSRYLLQASESDAKTSWQIDSALAGKGKQLFSQLRCVNCHADVIDTAPALPHPAALVDLDPNGGCLSGESGKWPQYSLDETDQQQITAAIQSLPSELSAEQEINITLATLNCFACHRRDNIGGVTTARSHHFQTTNLNLGEQGRIPPTLTGVGAKLNEKWMRDVLVNDRSIRPYMKTRMPQYGAANVNRLIELLQSHDRLSETKFAAVDDAKEMQELGLKIAGNQGLNCVACHTFRYEQSDTMPAVDLTEMAERLKKDWFYQYMLDPPRFSPNTVMPSFWPNGKAIRPDIAGDAKTQVEALWQYLLEGRQARAPRGLIAEPLKLVANDEAVMLRRSYPEIGKRGIGVGYPNQVNLAFDAEQMRLAMIWKGEFADPSGVWRGQGHGTVRPLGDNLIRFDRGPEIDDPVSPWIVDDGRPPHHRFKGYSLDKKMRPQFSYEFANVVVNDYYVDMLDSATNDPYIRRILTLKSGSGETNIVFRAATGKTIEPFGDGSFLVDDRLQIHIDEKHTGSIVDQPDTQHLRIPLKVNADEQQLILEYRW